MTATMKAAVSHEFGGKLTIEQVPRPSPRKGEVLIRVESCGVCHTDLHAITGDWPAKPTLPFIPGHEGVGLIEEVGPGPVLVDVGQRVGVPWLFSACGHCDYCLSGWETLCQRQQNGGYSVNGSFAEYVVAPAAYVAVIPSDLEPAQAGPILCAGVTTYKGIKETETRPGQWIAISGIGGLGHLAVQYAKAMGLRVAAVDVSDEKLELAQKLGAAVTVNAKSADPAKTIQSQTGGVHGALVTAVSVPAFHQALEMLRPGGTCVLVGLPPGEFPTPIFDVVLKRLTIRGSIVGTRMDMKEALQFAADGKVMATIETQPLEAINEVFARMREGTINGRVVVNC
ncbi:MAG: alcohol dehydrogenase AdhP [Planctomycetales bacterium]|nr:alcohol dehydrogenase AdhP [Planctomycetales bacterium]